jgi:hypothetical protein
MSGLALARAFYRAEVAPRLVGLPHGAALLGEGSEVLGLDDAVSADHDFGPRLQVFTGSTVDPADVEAALVDLPERFDGYPVAFGHTRDPRIRHRVEVVPVADWFRARLGVDPAAGMGLADWLLTPTQVLASLTGGEVFHDPAGEVAARRAALAWYPDDVWRYVLAAGWMRLAQEEPLHGRTGGRGDDLGSRLLAARLVRDLVRLAFLVRRRWAPYGKWLGTAFDRLPPVAGLRPDLDAALRSDDWREREAALVAAAARLGAATNALDLAGPVDAAPRRFHTRDIRISAAESFAAALVGAVTDPALRDLLARLGYRPGGVPPLPGAIDQSVDSTEVLMRPDRCRAAAPLLGLA